MSSNNWETYYDGEFEGPHRRGATPGISINKALRLDFNPAALELLGKPDAVLLKFDRGRRVIGVEPASLATRGALPLRDQGRTRVFYVNAAKFCRKFGIIIDRTERFDAPQIGEDGILRLDLKTTRDVTNWRNKLRRERGIGRQ